MQPQAPVTAGNVAAATNKDAASKASTDARVKTLEDENRRLKGQLERSEDAKRDAEAMVEGYRLRLTKLEEQHKV